MSNLTSPDEAVNQQIILTSDSYQDPEIDGFNIEQLEGMAEDEVEHIITLLCLKEKQLKYDEKILKEWYKDLKDAVVDKREKILDHLKTRKEADRQVMNILAAETGKKPASVTSLRQTTGT
jgi:hypothetical protein